MAKFKFIMPESGYGDFDDYFNACYDEAEGKLLNKHPEWASHDYDNERISGACDIAEKATVEHIKALGYEIVYPDYDTSSVIGHTNGGESSSGEPETPPTDDGEAEDSGEDR